MKTISLLVIIGFLFIGCENRADSQRNNNYDNDTILTEDTHMNDQDMDQDTTNMDTHPHTSTRTIENNRGMNETSDTATNRVDTMNSTR